MPVQKMSPRQYATALVPSTTSTENAIDFGFQATEVQLVNDRAAAVFVNFDSTTASTGGYLTCSGETLAVRNFGRMSGMAVASTTTSTGTMVRILALG